MTFRHARTIQDQPGLPRVQRAVLIAIALRADRYGEAWPSIRRISTDTGYSESWVRQAIKQLAKAAGNRTLQEEAILLMALGTTSLAEVQRVLKQ